LTENESLPEGCVRDLKPANNEYRRVTFMPGDGMPGTPLWNIRTDIVPTFGPDLKAEGDFDPDPAAAIMSTNGLGVPFEDYVGPDGRVDWTHKRHVCIEIDHGSHEGSHKQLWVLSNSTNTLHNFHIHQMKFRLATGKELMEKYHIQPPSPTNTCGLPPAESSQPDYKCFDPAGPDVNDPGALPLWHDTIPMPPNGSEVFVIMSYDAKEQLGRFVFHCHILKHEDRGLMAPIEVWEPTAATLSQKSNTPRSRK